MKQTKIVATISDMNCTVEMIQKLYDSGMDVVRLNTAHQTPEDTLKVVKMARQVSEKLAILVDIKGPEIRTTKVDDDVQLEEGNEVRIAHGVEHSTEDMIYVSYEGIVNDLDVGSEILIDDGEIGLEVIGKESDALVCRVQNSATLKSKKSVNLPNVETNLPSLTEKDKQYCKFCVEHGIDFIAHSFVRKKEDVLAVKEEIGDAPIKIIAKVENKEGVDKIDEILEEAYGVMVARGDMGIELPAEEVPGIQKSIIEKCMLHAKPVITATQMLQSMIDNPRPTRAEVSDVANAILDGTDAIMLSGETAYGKYPVESVQQMAKIAKTVEPQRPMFKYLAMKQKNTGYDAQLARAAVAIASEVPISAIIVPSIGGTTARMVAAFRGTIPIYAECYRPHVMRQLALSFGIRAGDISREENTDALVRALLQDLVNRQHLKYEDNVLILGGTVDADHTNFMEITSVKNGVAR